MPTYPQHRAADSSTCEKQKVIVGERASNGAYHGRQLSAEKRTWKLRHILTRQEYSDFKAFADANFGIALDFRWPRVYGDPCTVHLVGPINEIRWINASRSVEIEVLLEEA